MKIIIKNINTNKVATTFKNIINVREDILPNSIVFESEKHNFLFKLRECDYIHIEKDD